MFLLAAVVGCVKGAFHAFGFFRFDEIGVGRIDADFLEDGGRDADGWTEGRKGGGGGMQSLLLCVWG